MNLIPTVEIRRGVRCVRINAEDYRPGVHELWREQGAAVVAAAPAPSPQPEPKPSAPKAAAVKAKQRK